MGIRNRCKLKVSLEGAHGVRPYRLKGNMELPKDHVQSLSDERAGLLDQLRYLISEAQALAPLLNDLPTEVLEMRPPEGWSTKQTLGLLADCDRQVFLPRLHRIVADDRPQVEAADEEALVEGADWNEKPVEEILAAVREARGDTVSFLDNLPPEEWARSGILPDGDPQNIYELALHITRHDLKYLRQLGRRMHEANLTDGQDLPK